MKYSGEWLINAGIPVTEYFFFWGHTQKREGIVDRSCFSQWYPAIFTVDNISYATAEHWMMAKKASLFGDIEVLKEILLTPKPAVAKKLGREVRNFDATKWNASAYDIVVEGNRHKFSQQEELKSFLLETGSKIIIEASPFDPIWGIGMAQDSKGATDPVQWKGTNLLGFALMEVRDELR